METTWLSWSRLRTHEECKQAGKLNREGKKQAVDNHRNFLPGNITDRVVRDWLLDDPWNNLGQMPNMVTDYLDKALRDIEEQNEKNRQKEAETGKTAQIGYVKFNGPDDKDKIIEKCIRAVTEIEPDLVNYVIPFEYTPDYAFQSTVDVPLPDGRVMQVILNGFMDILVKHSEGNYFIFDVKHTENEQYWKKTIGQLAFYDTALMIAEGYNSRYSALLQPLCKEKRKSFDITQDDRQKMWSSITRYALDVANDVATPTTNRSICTMCRFKHACVLFKPKMVNGKAKVSL